MAAWIKSKLKGVHKMKPMPKAVGWFGAIAAVATAIYNGMSSGDWTGLAAAIGALLALFSHSATGTGGKPE
jgi:hypothetical protein